MKIIIEFIFALANVTLIALLIGIKLYEYKFVNNRTFAPYDDGTKDYSIIILPSIIIFIEIIIGFFNFNTFKNNLPTFFIKCNIILSLMYITWLIYKIFFSFRGKYARKYIEIKKLKKQINEIDYTFNNKEAVKILNITLQKLNKELEALLLNKTIKQAKKIEISFKKDIISKELDELQALQELNKK